MTLYGPYNAFTGATIHHTYTHPTPPPLEYLQKLPPAVAAAAAVNARAYTTELVRRLVAFGRAHAPATYKNGINSTALVRIFVFGKSEPPPPLARAYRRRRRAHQGAGFRAAE